MSSQFGIIPRRRRLTDQSPILVTHFGTNIRVSGGIASVLRSYAERSPHGYSFRFVSSYDPASRFWSFWPLVYSLRVILFRNRLHLGIVHLHMANRGSFVRKIVLIWAARTRRLPICVTIHSGEFADSAKRRRRLYRLGLLPANLVIFLGESIRLRVTETIQLDRTAALGNAVSVPPSVTPVADSPPHVLFAGDVGIRKGVDILLGAWVGVHDRIPGARLFLAGELGDVEHVQLPGVEWLGPTPHADVLSMIERSRVGVLPSRAEGMPMFLLETMARGRPVVATRVGAVEDLVADCGRVLPGEDVAELRDALIYYLSDPARAEADGSRARRRVIDQFSLKACTDQLAELYDQVLESVDASAGQFDRRKTA